MKFISNFLGFSFFSLLALFAFIFAVRWIQEGHILTGILHGILSYGFAWVMGSFVRKLHVSKFKGTP